MGTCACVNTRTSTAQRLRLADTVACVYHAQPATPTTDNRSGTVTDTCGFNNSIDTLCRSGTFTIIQDGTSFGHLAGVVSAMMDRLVVVVATSNRRFDRC